MQAYTVADSVADARSDLDADARSDLHAGARAIGHTDACADLDVRPLLHALVPRTQPRAHRTNVAGSLTHACTPTHTLADTPARCAHEHARSEAPLGPCTGLAPSARGRRDAAGSASGRRDLLGATHDRSAIAAPCAAGVYGAGTGVARRVVGA